MPKESNNLFPDLSPIDKAPSLTTLNTFGFKLYGKSDYDDETDSYMTTHYFVALFIPLFPIARYRVISDDGDGYRFLGKGKLRGIDWAHMAIFAAIVIYMIKTAGLK
ncbi:hypothetical protein BWI17_03760 [Betaproteobacteria bacterium GR16-43]|nr:hypothetical protein BWI17_03760 [Betaproteobacteria bacterium GR16-43]